MGVCVLVVCVGGEGCQRGDALHVDEHQLSGLLISENTHAMVTQEATGMIAAGRRNRQSSAQ